MAKAARARQLGKRFLMFDHMLVVAGFYLVFPIIGLHFVGQLQWAAAAVGLALGVRQMSQQGLALFGGSLSDRFGAKPMIVAGMLLRALGFAVMAFAANPAVLLLSCVLSGLGGALFDPARAALVAKLTRPAQRPRFYALLMVQESVAAVTGALLGTMLLGLNFQWVALGGCAVFVLAALANQLLLPAYRAAPPGTSALAAMRTPLRDRPFLLLVLTLSGYYILTVQLMLLVPVTLTPAGRARQLHGVEPVRACPGRLVRLHRRRLAAGLEPRRAHARPALAGAGRHRPADAVRACFPRRAAARRQQGVMRKKRARQRRAENTLVGCRIVLRQAGLESLQSSPG
ncbi:MAG: multidrug transporter MdtH [Pseudoduganella sp.]|nr:multidrug transporter MdtH [Pseudoduganella sp.]